jgi:hypothetical protein
MQPVAGSEIAAPTAAAMDPAVVAADLTATLRMLNVEVGRVAEAFVASAAADLCPTVAPPAALAAAQVATFRQVGSVTVSLLSALAVRMRALGLEMRRSEPPARGSDSAHVFRDGLHREITCSSAWAPESLHGAHQSVMDSAAGAGAWCAGCNDGAQWIAAKLERAEWVTRIGLQGRPTSSGWPQFVRRFKVEVRGGDTPDWREVGEFEGVASPDETVWRDFETPQWASEVRLQPLEWNTHTSMRWDIAVHQERS